MKTRVAEGRAGCWREVPRAESERGPRPCGSAYFQRIGREARHCKFGQWSASEAERRAIRRRNAARNAETRAYLRERRERLRQREDG